MTIRQPATFGPAESRTWNLAVGMLHLKVSSDRLPYYVVRGVLCGARHDEGRFSVVQHVMLGLERGCPM